MRRRLCLIGRNALIMAFTPLLLLAMTACGYGASPGSPTAAPTSPTTVPSPTITTGPTPTAVLSAVPEPNDASDDEDVTRIQNGLAYMNTQMQGLPSHMQQIGRNQQESMIELMTTMVGQMSEFTDQVGPAYSNLSREQRRSLSPAFDQMYGAMRGIGGMMGGTGMMTRADPSSPGALTQLGQAMSAMHQQMTGGGGMMGQVDPTQMMNNVNQMMSGLHSFSLEVGPYFNRLSPSERELAEDKVFQMQDTMRQMYTVLNVPAPAPSPAS